MVTLRTFGRVEVREPLHPADVAGDVHSRLARMRRDAICLHAENDLGLVFTVALEHPDAPLVVTTGSVGWEALADDRRWCEREGSVMFVVSTQALGGIHEQVATLLSTPRSVFVRTVPRHDPRARELLRRARELLEGLFGANPSRLRHHALDIGLDAGRIDFNRATLDVAFDYVEEADRALLLIPAFERLRRDYGLPEVEALLRDARTLYLEDV
jgi:hypothetical protein